MSSHCTVTMHHLFGSHIVRPPRLPSVFQIPKLILKSPISPYLSTDAALPNTLPMRHKAFPVLPHAPCKSRASATTNTIGVRIGSRRDQGCSSYPLLTLTKSLVPANASWRAFSLFVRFVPSPLRAHAIVLLLARGARCEAAVMRLTMRSPRGATRAALAVVNTTTSEGELRH